MAKRSKAKTSKAKIPKARTRTEKVTPTYLQAGAGFTIGLHDVVRALKVIEKHKHLDKFVKAAKQNDASVRVGADTVNFVKDFMVKHKMHGDPVGKHLVNATVATEGGLEAMRDPFRPCTFSRRG